MALAEAREEVFVMLLLWGAAAGIVAVMPRVTKPYSTALAMVCESDRPARAAKNESRRSTPTVRR